jgi:hypothetical protein
MHISPFFNIFFLFLLIIVKIIYIHTKKTKTRAIIAIS